MEENLDITKAAADAAADELTSLTHLLINALDALPGLGGDCNEVFACVEIVSAVRDELRRIRSTDCPATYYFLGGFASILDDGAGNPGRDALEAAVLGMCGNVARAVAGPLLSAYEEECGPLMGGEVEHAG